MDTFSHMTLGVLVVEYADLLLNRNAQPYTPPKKLYKRGEIYAALAFGGIPDLCSFGAFFAQRIFQGRLLDLNDIPAYVELNYTYTHSLVIAVIFGVILFCINRKWCIPYLAWPLHILCDIPTHDISFYATPFLFPLSNYRFDGVSMRDNSWIMPLYWCVIMGLIVYAQMWRRRLIKSSS